MNRRTILKTVTVASGGIAIGTQTRHRTAIGRPSAGSSPLSVYHSAGWHQDDLRAGLGREAPSDLLAAWAFNSNICVTRISVLTAEGLRCVASGWRGHGRSPRGTTGVDSHAGA